MLSFITTDADLTPALLQSCLTTAVDRTFNRILVDGDTSTNDTVLLLANRQAEAGKVTRRHGLSRFRAALEYVASCLAYEIVRDGEGASKLIEIRVRNAASEKDALKIGRTIAGSPLVKTALGGGDPNWGRILAAAGRSGVRFRPELVDLILGGVEVVRGGAACDFNEKKAAASVAASEIQVTFDLNAGKEEATVLTCDLTAAYIRLNSLYHT
jgi:glutamate N-acetyltransferase/amino-acid N-acetyltransferase